MGWFEILKVDIDFDSDERGFGAYAMQIAPDMDSIGEIMEKVERGDVVGIRDFMKEKITINHQSAYSYLKQKLEREPKDQELMQFITRVIMHEGTHAGMGEEQMAFADHQSEYGAMTGQFPEDTYLRLKNYIQHPATAQQFMPPMMAFMANSSGRHDFDNTRKIKDILAFIDGMVDNLPKREMELAREKLTRMEVLARKDKSKKDIREVDIRDFDALVSRYGAKHKTFLLKLARSVNEEEGIEFTDEELKMIGAVTTASAPAMFNKVVRGRKKRRRKQ